MDDKMVTIFDAALAQMAMTIEEMRRAMVVTGQIPPEISTQNTQKTVVSTQLREMAARDYMSGRWVRRDGDIYGLHPGPRAITSEPSGDGKTGNLRPPAISGG